MLYLHKDKGFVTLYLLRKSFSAESDMGTVLASNDPKYKIYSDTAFNTENSSRVQGSLDDALELYNKEKKIASRTLYRHHVDS